jgi:hypothetical protein
MMIKEARDENSDESEKDDAKQDCVLHTQEVTALEVAVSSIEQQEKATTTDVMLLNLCRDFVPRN